MLYFSEERMNICAKGALSFERKKVYTGWISDRIGNGYLSIVGKGHDSLPLWMEQPLFFLSVY
jgi:hypothetical protein